jgi:hypothetical protein
MYFYILSVVIIAEISVESFQWRSSEVLHGLHPGVPTLDKLLASLTPDNKAVLP